MQLQGPWKSWISPWISLPKYSGNPASPPSPSPPLEVGPLNPARESGGVLKAPPTGSGAEPQPKSNLVHFSYKIWHMVATNLMIFIRIECKVSCRISKFYAEFGNKWIVQNIELWLPVNSNWTIWIFYSFTTGECSVRSSVLVFWCTVIINESLNWI